MPPPTLPELRAWLLERSLPLWLDHGVDRTQAGFHESLSHEGYACDAPYRRLRVLARQIVVFSLAHRHGVAGAADAVAMGLDTLTRRAGLPEGGYAWRFDLAHTHTDTTRDLYDHAFVLLALAQASAVLPASTLRPRALALLAFLDTHMAHPAGGYVEAIPAALPRRQNPHMHLLEALLAADAAFGDPIFLDRAHALIALFTGRMLDAATGALPEFYDEAWRPITTSGAFQIEPGHHHEWAWLLHEYRRKAGPDPAHADPAHADPAHADPAHADPAHANIAARLLAFADAYGTHPTTHDVIDSIDSRGKPLAHSARLWPQAERLKTAYLRPDRTQTIQCTALASLAAYLRPDGLWHERRDAHGHFIPGPAPASTLYHLATAILTGAPD